MDSKRYTLTAKEPLGEDLIRLELFPADKHPLQYKPGQFVNLGIMKGDECLVKRPYSIASSPDSPSLEFCIKNIGGQFTSRLPALDTGQEFLVEGPFGGFKYDEGRPTVFICGGVGIAPAMSVMRYADGKATEKIVVFYSARSPPQMPYRSSIFEIERRNLHIKVIPALTREIPPGWTGLAGRFTESDFDRILRDYSLYTFFVCGPEKMVDSIKEILLSKGVNEKNAFFEGWKV